jgi:hypothetical protein
MYKTQFLFSPHTQVFMIATQYLVNKGMNTSKTSLSGLSPLFISVTKAPYLESSVLPSYYTSESKQTSNFWAGNSNRYLSKNSILQYTHCVFLSLKIILRTQPRMCLRIAMELLITIRHRFFILQTVYQSKSIDYTTLAKYLCMWGEKELGLIHLAAANGWRIMICHHAWTFVYLL